MTESPTKKKKAVRKKPVPKSTAGSVYVSRIYKDRGIVSKDDGPGTELIEVPALAPEAIAGSVEVAQQMTINLGNFESVQVRVGCSLPCYVAELDDAYSAALRFVETRLSKEVQEIKEYRASKPTEE